MREDWEQFLSQYPQLEGSALGDWFGKSDNPADYARRYYDQIPGVMKPYYDPYIEAGRGALGRSQQEYGNLLDDPTSITNRIGSHYQESPGYQFALDQGEQAVTNAQAAGGMAGSPQHQQLAAQLAAQMANQDYNNWMRQQLGLYETGLSGMGGLNQMGYGASTGLGENLGRALMNQGNLAYTGKQNENQQSGSMWGNILGAGAAIAGALL